MQRHDRMDPRLRGDDGVGAVIDVHNVLLHLCYGPLLHPPIRNRIANTANPCSFKAVWKLGTNCFNFPAAELLATSKHQLLSSTGPAFTAPRNAAGTKGSIANKRALDSCNNLESCANVVEFSTAWLTVKTRREDEVMRKK